MIVFLILSEPDKILFGIENKIENCQKNFNSDSRNKNAILCPRSP